MSHAKHPAYCTEEPRQRFLSGYAAPFVVMLGLGIAPAGVSASPPSPATVEALGRLSASKPCAAAALLYVMLKADNASSGVFYLPGVPTPNEVARLISLPDAGVEDFPVQTNLYGDVSYYTEVRWSLEKLNDRVIMVSADAQLVNSAAVKIVPSHVIEPLTRVLMAGSTLHVLPRASVE